ncbi:MAG TPA: hypothetical protein VHV83_04910 [Armatimonadota bacterium]|nr:hypothetical protein [Armatimonadota bacterium]
MRRIYTLILLTLLCYGMSTASAIDTHQGSDCYSCPTTQYTVTTQPPIRGIVTFIEPHGQFYINIGSKEQLYKGATLRIFRDDCEIAHATVIKVNMLDAIAQLGPEQMGVLLQSSDLVLVDFNPIPAKPPSGLPKIEPNPSMNDYDIVYGALFLLGIGSIIAHELD